MCVCVCVRACGYEYIIREIISCDIIACSFTCANTTY